MQETEQYTSTVSLGLRYARSRAFSELFAGGIALVEQTAVYLDGPGRADSKQLEHAAQLEYATQSMRTTTRLMQAASWLLAMRAVKEGEITLKQFHLDKPMMWRTLEARKFDDLASPRERIALLPIALQALIIRADVLCRNIVRVERNMLSATPEPLPLQATAGDARDLQALLKSRIHEIP